MSQVLSGPRAKLMLDEKQVGAVTGWTCREEVEHQPFDPIGQIHTEENVPVKYSVSGTTDTVRIVGNPATKVNLFPNYRDLILGGKSFTMQLQDASGVVVKTVFKVKFNSAELRVEGRAISGENIGWLGCTADDEFTSATSNP